MAYKLWKPTQKSFNGKSAKIYCFFIVFLKPTELSHAKRKIFSIVERITGTGLNCKFFLRNFHNIFLTRFTFFSFFFANNKNNVWTELDYLDSPYFFTVCVCSHFQNGGSSCWKRKKSYTRKTIYERL